VPVLLLPYVPGGGIVIVVPTCVYRFYDAEGRLLYVGVTYSPAMRFREHARRDWWADAVRNTIVWHDRRADALAEEARAIATEGPLHNIAGVDAEDQPLPETLEEFEALPQWKPRPYKPRRVRGEGALYFKKRPGRSDLWIARIDIGFGEDGRRLVKEASSTSREVAERKLAELKAKYHAA